MINPIGRIPTKDKKAEYRQKTSLFTGKFSNPVKLPLMVAKRSSRSSNRIPKESIPVVSHSGIPMHKEDGLSFYWLGHSTILIQTGKINILIDPILTRYASPLKHVGVKRFSQIPIEPDNLPEIDILLISHDHYDHLDHKTLLAIRRKIKHIVVPLGVECILSGWGFDKKIIRALNWWEETKIAGVTVTATPAQHFSGRNPIKSNATWWCGFCIQTGKHTVYYSGDGGYSAAFKEIGNKFDIDLAFLECGQYDEAWPNCHMFPEQTARAALDVRSKYSIPIHWGAYCLCNSAWNDSVIRFRNEADKLGVNNVSPIIGECVNYEEIEAHDKNWWSTSSISSGM